MPDEDNLKALKTNYSIKLKRRKKNTWKFIIIAILMVAIIFALLFIFVFSKKKDDSSDIIPTASIIDVTSTAVTAETIDISNVQREAKIRSNSINYPYVYGNEIIYSSRRDGKGGFKRMIIYKIEEETEKEYFVKVKYNNINNLVMNSDYIAYLDSSELGGGRICVMDRSSGEVKSVKDYAYAMPKLVLIGNKLAFLQQAGVSTDRLYIYDMETGESVCAKVFEGNVGLNGGLSADGDKVIYSVIYYEDDMLKSHVTELDVITGEEISYDWDRYVYAPEKNNGKIVFLSSASGVPDDLYISDNGDTPMLLETDVTNMKVGDGFVAYTKDDGIYGYVFQTGKRYRLSKDLSKALLQMVDGHTVCWYDVTSYNDVDAIKYCDFRWE